jgi:hypothetical protein
MSFRLKAKRPVMEELKRTVRKQLLIGSVQLRINGRLPSDAAIHEARRRIKKVCAAMRLAKEPLEDLYRPTTRRLRSASRMLAPIADGEAVIRTIDRLGQKYGEPASRKVMVIVQAALIERAAIRRREAVDRILMNVAGIMRTEAANVLEWNVHGDGFRTIAPGLERTFRRARNTGERTTIAPTFDGHHEWRRHVKDLWLQLRLLEGRCGDQLQHDERRLESLDEFLGEHHNVTLLEHLLIAEHLLSRSQTASCLRLLRRYQLDLQHMARAFGGAFFAEKPRHFVARVRQSWRSTDGEASP